MAHDLSFRGQLLPFDKQSHQQKSKTKEKRLKTNISRRGNKIPLEPYNNAP